MAWLTALVMALAGAVGCFALGRAGWPGPAAGPLPAPHVHPRRGEPPEARGRARKHTSPAQGLWPCRHGLNAQEVTP
jgi:hypothetical protein